MIETRTKTAALAIVGLCLLGSGCASLRNSEEPDQGNQRIFFHFVPVPPRFDAPPTGYFNPRIQILPVERRTPIVGVPSNLTETSAQHAFVERGQYFYQALHAGLISEAFFKEISADVDTTLITREWLDGSLVTAVLGKDADGRRVILVDQDGDGDFSSEQPLHFAPDTVLIYGKSDPVMAARAKVTFEYWNGDRIRKRTAPVRLFYKESADPIDLVFQIMEHAVGTWKVSGEEFRVALGPQAVFRPSDFEYLFVDVAADGVYDTDPTGLEAYPLSQPFNMGGTAWKVKKIHPAGTSVTLSDANVPVRPRTALRVGVLAPGFEARTLTGESVSLEELRGKPVLLNFAGTGCPYSRAELPFLKEAHSAFARDELVILSLVDDTQGPRLDAYLREFTPTWQQVHQNRTDEIGRIYRVLGWPTNYLLNSDGVIVSSGSDLRGEKLMITLQTHLGRNNP